MRTSRASAATRGPTSGTKANSCGVSMGPLSCAAPAAGRRADSLVHDAALDTGAVKVREPQDGCADRARSVRRQHEATRELALASE